MNSVFEGLSSRDLTQKSISVQTVGFIGESVEGKMALDKLGLYRVYMAISKLLIWNILKIMGYNLPKTCTYGDMFLRFIDKIKMVNIPLIEEVIMN